MQNLSPRVLTFSVAALACALATPVCGVAQSASPQAAPPAMPIGQYIHHAWSGLERSMTDCSSLVDTKSTGETILYLPYGVAEPASVAALKFRCHVDVRHLPRRIDHPASLLPSEIPNAGLLYLPNAYVVPGGRFNEQYGWDSYFILLGLLQDKQLELARGMVENFFYEIENYGNILNANRTYYLTRSQPPLLSSMIRAVYDATPDADAWLATAYSYAVRDHALWLTPAHRAGKTGLARYHDSGAGPVPEMADDSTYYPDVIHWLLAHPEVKTNYLVEGPDLAPGAQPSPQQAAEIHRVSCDAVHSAVCARAHVGTHWLTPAFYEGDRADRESGFDTTYRFGPFAGSTEDYAPADLNALLYKYENDLAWMADRLHKPDEAQRWRAEAAARKQAIDKYLWSAKLGTYMDWNFATHTQSTYAYISEFYPLWAGVASAQQAASVAKQLPAFLHPGGVAMSTFNSGLQWDLPFGWAPTMYFTVAGLERAGFDAQARDVAGRFLHSVDAHYAQDGTIREKYNVVDPSTEVQVTNGYRQNVIGFGWTNATYLRFKALLAAPPKDGNAALGNTP